MNNKATRLNRTMMYGMFFLAIVVLAVVYGFMYLALDKPAEQQQSTSAEHTDSITILIDGISESDSI